MIPSVNESGKFKGSNNHISKRSTHVSRKTLYAVILACINKKHNGQSINTLLFNYYKNNMNGILNH
ncbi:transposase [Intestinibacter bartlettii]|uniref:transposase n=1 Tax=Intestinibacter bartlettii TaxID=261299 RepID=UPI0009EB11AB